MLAVLFARKVPVTLQTTDFQAARPFPRDCVGSRVILAQGATVRADSREGCGLIGLNGGRMGSDVADILVYVLQVVLGTQAACKTPPSTLACVPMLGRTPFAAGEATNWVLFAQRHVELLLPGKLTSREQANGVVIAGML
jgi:hypothetical protein